MKNTFALAAALAVFGSISATAQSPTEGIMGATATMGLGWDEVTADAFFTDDGTMNLQSDSDIQNNWHQLPPEVQSQIRADCDMILHGPFDVENGDEAADPGVGGSAPQDELATDQGEGTDGAGLQGQEAGNGGGTGAATDDVGAGVIGEADEQFNGAGVTNLKGISAGMVPAGTWHQLCELVLDIG